MNSLLLKASANLIVPLQIFLSLVLLLRGHNEPGGGFIGGLVCASAFILYGVANDMTSARKRLFFHPLTLIGAGLLASAISGLPGLYEGGAFLAGVWTDIAVPTYVAGKVKLGTPLLFDVGVFLLVLGIATLMAFTMSEEEEV